VQVYTDSVLDVKQWRCTVCISNELLEKDPSEKLIRSSVPKLAKDLLPSHRGQDPGGHSIFNNLILPDDPGDGSRSLRKRKASLEDEAPGRSFRKKRKSSDASRSEVGASVAATSPHAQTRSVITDGNDTDGAPNTASEHDSMRVRSSRARRTKPKRNDKRPLVWIEESQGLSLVVVFHLNNEKVQQIVTSKPKKKPMTTEQERQERRRERDRERRERNRRAAQAAREMVEESHYPSIQTNVYTTPFYSFGDKEMDESKSKPYGGILSEAEADTSKTYPLHADRVRFEDARKKAEEDWKQKQEALYAGQETKPTAKNAGPPSKIKCINFGGWEVDTWHAAPYPEEYSKNRVLYICEFCLKYMSSDYVAWRHKVDNFHIVCGFN
jgi:histone acetyltransferase SAS3